MKTIIRIFNILILVLSALATASLFLTPTFVLHSKITLSTDSFSKMIPENTYTGPIDAAKILGTSEINVGINVNFTFNDVSQSLSIDKNTINEKIINENINSVAETFYEPIDIVTEYTVRTVVKKIVKDEIKKQIENARTQYAIDSGSTAEEIMEEVGMTDQYFVNFAKSLYDAANEINATLGSFTNTLFWQIDEAVKKAETGTGGVAIDSSKFGDDKKEEIKNGFINILNDLKMIVKDTTVPEDEQKLVRVSHLAYTFLSTYLSLQLENKVSDPNELVRKADESILDYTKRLLNMYVENLLPNTFYQIIGYFSLAVFIGIFVFALIWVILFLITIIRMFSSKPWTIFGPWFWIIGSLQIILGVGLTVTGKFILPKFNIPLGNIPISSFVVVPRTFAFIASLIFVFMIFFAIVYAIFRHKAKVQYRESLGGTR